MGETPEGRCRRDAGGPAIDSADDCLDAPLVEPLEVSFEIAPHPPDAPPVFFGHYWLEGEPELLAGNVACVDWSVAKGGCLCAYRWDGETLLSPERLVSVPARSSGPD